MLIIQFPPTCAIFYALTQHLTGPLSFCYTFVLETVTNLLVVLHRRFSAPNIFFSVQLPTCRGWRRGGEGGGRVEDAAPLQHQTKVHIRVAAKRKAHGTRCTTRTGRRRQKQQNFTRPFGCRQNVHNTHSTYHWTQTGAAGQGHWVGFWWRALDAYCSLCCACFRPLFTPSVFCAF